MSIRDYLKRISSELNRKKALNKEVVNSQQSQLPIDFAGSLNADKTKVSLPDGTEGRAQISGTPASTDAVVQIGSDIYYVVNQSRRNLQVDGNKKGYLILKSTSPTGFKFKYFLQDIDDKDVVYEIDTYAVAGLPAPTVDTGDYVTFVGFSNKGKHVLVGGVIDNHNRENPLSLRWGILKNWKLKKNVNNEPEIDFTLEQGTKEINTDDFDDFTAPDPGNPGPSSVDLIYERDHTGGGQSAVCPWNNTQGTYGGTAYVTKYERKETKRYREVTTDPKLVELANPGPDLNIIDYTYGFSETAAGGAVVDFGFAFTSVYRRFTLYNLEEEEVLEDYEVKEDTFKIGCAEHCITTRTRHTLTVQTNTQGDVVYNVRNDLDYVNNPCKGYKPNGDLDDQIRALSTEADIEQICTRQGAGTGDFCISAPSGPCSDPYGTNGLTFHNFCPEGWPTCYKQMLTECEIATYPSHLAGNYVLQECELNQFNYSKKENVTKGIMVMSKLNGVSSNTNKETGTEVNNSLLVVVTASRDSCVIPLKDDPWSFSGNGTIFHDYWDRVEEAEEEGFRYATLPRKLFRDLDDGTSILVQNTVNGDVEWLSPFGTTKQVLGPVLNFGQLAASDDQAFTTFTLDEDAELVVPISSTEFRSYKTIAPSPRIEIRTWKKRDANYKPDERVRGSRANPGLYNVVDFILK